MRRALAVAAIASLVLLAALLPATAEAAPAAAYGTITGTLVATPQATVPTTLLLQVGGQTIPVSITSGTQIIDSVGNALSLSSLRDGDTLQVSGTPNVAGGIDASVVQDLSQAVTTPPTTTSLVVTGTLATEYAGVLCLANAGVVSSAISPNLATVSPCPSGELPAYLTGSTTFEDAGGNAINLSSLMSGDSLEVTGTLSGNQFFASLVQDLSRSIVTTPPPTSSTYAVTGTLATEYTGVLCLANASVVGNAITPNWAIASPCPSGELPVYVTSGTGFEDASGNAIGLGSLAIGDSLEATGTVSGGQLTASLVQDLSRSVTTPPTTTSYVVTGTLATEYSGVLCLASASVVGNAVTPNWATVSPCPSGELPAYLTGSTSFEDANGSPVASTVLAIGDSLEVTGTLSSGQLFASLVQDLSRAITTTTANPIATWTLVGTVQSFNFSGDLKRFTLQVQQGPVHGSLTIYVQNTTRFVAHGARTVKFSALHKGQVVTVRGTYNKHSHRWVTTAQVAIH